MSTVFGLFFVAAQGGAIFLTAKVLSEFFGGAGLVAKICWMAASYAAWVLFTFALFGVLGADVFLIPAVGAVTAAISSAICLPASS